jgi:hypothetical protein
MKKYSRRSFIAGLSITAPAVFASPSYIPNLFNSKSTINGVQLGVISYSFREMTDQSAEAILQYIKECGVNGVELMGETAESFLATISRSLAVIALTSPAVFCFTFIHSKFI